MNFFRWLFGGLWVEEYPPSFKYSRKSSGRFSEQSSPDVSGHGSISINIGNNDLENLDHGSVDLRSEDERQIEKRAQSMLEIHNEKIAKELISLTAQLDPLYNSNKAAFAELQEKITNIGMCLCQNGGSDRMKLIAYRVQALGGSIQDLEYHWQGLCGWEF